MRGLIQVIPRVAHQGLARCRNSIAVAAGRQRGADGGSTSPTSPYLRRQFTHFDTGRPRDPRLCGHMRNPAGLTTLCQAASTFRR